MTPEAHHVVVVVGAPEVRTVAGTEVGFVTFWLVDPLPVEVTPEVDVERAQAAALVRATETHTHTQYVVQLPPFSSVSWENYHRSPSKNQPSHGNNYAGLPEFSPAA